MNGSATPFPTYLFQLPVLDYCRDCRVSAVEGEHLLAILKIILGVSVFEGDAFLIVMVSGFRTVRTAGFSVYHDAQLKNLLDDLYFDCIGAVGASVTK